MSGPGPWKITTSYILGGSLPNASVVKKNSYVFNQIELTQGVTQWRNTDHLLSVWLHLIRSGQSESAQRGPHWREAFMFFKCVSGVNKFWHFSKIEPNQLSNSALQWCAPCMYYQMPPQMARLRWRITTRIAFELLFSAVYFQIFQMFPQIACLWGCIVTSNGLHGFSPLCVLNVRIFWPSRAVGGPQLTGQSMWWNATMSFPTWWWWRRRKSRGYTYGGFKYHHQTPGSH